MALKDYLTLIKPRVIWLLVLSAIAGYIIAGGINAAKVTELTIVGLLSTGGAAAFNMYYERDIDGLMARTRNRPLPSGRVKPTNALAYSLILSALGLALSYLWLGAMPTLMVALGWVLYAVVYTILLKRRTWLNILIGGFAGNAALLAGWLMAKPLNLEALLISMAIYLWIPAHIWSLAYYSRFDYRRAGVPMMPAVFSDDVSIRVISTLNALSIVYMDALYAFYLNNLAGYILIIPPSVLGLAISIRAIVKPSEGEFYRMFKATSPTLTLFLAASMLASFIR